MIDQVLADLVLRLAGGMAVVREQIPLIIEDPRSYDREAMLLALLVTLLLVFLVLTAFATWEAAIFERQRRRLGLKVRRRGRWRVPAGIAVALSGVLIVLSLVPMVPAAGPACGSCHAVESAVARWQIGSHRSTSCYGCHAARGPLGAMAASAGGAVRLANASEREGRVYEDSCLSCHRDVATGLVGRAVLMRHADVIEVSMPCLECHPGIGHAPDQDVESPDKAAERLARHRMSLCMTSHNDVIASAECGTCHEGRPLDVAVTLSERYETPMSITCRGCHTPDTEQVCIDCHGLEMPHPRPAFHRAHAGMSYRQPELCATCHDRARPSQQDACGCHGYQQNIHGTYSQWFPRHGPEARRNGPGACSCHSTGRFCGRCHDTPPF